MEEISALEAQVESAAMLTEKVQALNALALALRFHDLQRAIALCEQAIELASQPGAKSLAEQTAKAKSLYNLGILVTQDGQFEHALSILSKSLLAYEAIGQTIGSAQALSAIGRVYIYLNDYPNALDYHLRALETAQRIGDQETIAISLNNIGFMYIHMQEWQKALGYLARSLALAEKNADLRAQADALANLCYCHANIGDYPNSRLNGERALSIYQEIGSPQGISGVLNNLGATYQMEGDYQQALKLYHRSLRVSESISDQLEMVQGLRRIGEVHVHLGDFQVGLENLKKALDLAQKIQSRQEQYICHQALANAYRVNGDFASALNHHEQYHAIKEAVFSEEADKRLKMIEVGYQSDEGRKAAEAFQSKNLALQQEINERRDAEQALSNTNSQLQYEIAERERLISDLNAFTYMVAHDLKNPINGVIGYATLLSRKLKGSEDVQALRYLEIINQTGHRMNRIIEELLLLSSLREQRVIPAPLDMTQIVSEVEVRLQHMIEQYQAQITSPASWPPALGYAPWIEEVWANYITNAIKYGGIPPRITLGYDLSQPGQVRFWAQDNGDGIPVEQQMRLFSAFTRLEQARASGHGLGLSIVKRIVERLNGEVDVISTGQPGEGAIFSFSLPACEMPSDTSQEGGK